MPFQPSWEVKEKSLYIYEQWIVEVKNGSFTPLIFSTIGGMGRLSSIFYSRLALLLAEKRHQVYAVMGCLLTYILPIALINSVHPWHSITSKLHSSTSCILWSGCRWISCCCLTCSHSPPSFQHSIMCVIAYVVHYFSPLLQCSIVRLDHPAQLYTFMHVLAMYCTANAEDLLLSVITVP